MAVEGLRRSEHLSLAWRGGRAVQCTGLENRRAQALVGSNPTPSVSPICALAETSRTRHPPVRTHARFSEARLVGSSRAAREGCRRAPEVVLRETSEDAPPGAPQLHPTPSVSPICALAETSRTRHPPVRTHARFSEARLVSSSRAAREGCRRAPEVVLRETSEDAPPGRCRLLVTGCRARTLGLACPSVAEGGFFFLFCHSRAGKVWHASMGDGFRGCILRSVAS